MSNVLHLDFESRGVVDLPKTGVYVYAADHDTDVWCACMSPGDEAIGLWTPGARTPELIEQAVHDGWQIVAHNANFERVMWNNILTPRYGWPRPKLTQWRCTMAQALAMALPAGLENAASAVGLDVHKDQAGRRLMVQLAKPRVRNHSMPKHLLAQEALVWWDDDGRKNRLYQYCGTDVVVERQLFKRLLPLSQSEQEIWWLDQVINDRGVQVDVDLCNA